MDDSVRHFGSARPFGEFAKKYRDLGWLNPIPLPAKKKGPPPDGYTGHRAKPVDLQQLRFWVECNEKDNIGLKLHSHKFDEWAPELIREQEFEIVGIDMDEHPEEGKSGWSQYLSLAKDLGELRMTWTSSARTNGKAGIRFFLAPPGLMWRGDCGKQGPDIDIICRTYRFAVVFPSFHPKGGQYYWYGPGFDPDGINHSPDLPRPEDLSILPDSWVKFLTQDYTQYAPVPMDMDSTDAELRKWATSIFAEHGEMCDHMEKMLRRRLAELEDSDTSHPMLTKIHFELLRLGSKDGHTGWATACKQFERAWRLSVLDRNKRGAAQADSEIERSRTGALRKIKGKFDEMATAGEQFLQGYDPCTNPNSVDNGPIDFPKTKAREPEHYAMNDDGNAQHFLDLHDGYLLYVANGVTGWLTWQDRWVYDQIGLIRTLFRRVKERQETFARKVQADYDKVANQKNANAPKLKELAALWANWSRQSGEFPRIERAIKSAQSINDGIVRSFTDLDADRRAFGVMDKVLRIAEKTGEIMILDNTRERLITKNVGIPYISFAQQTMHPDPEIRKGHQLFVEFLTVWIAPYVDLGYFQKVCGSMLLGDTADKAVYFFYGPTNSGKSTLADLFVNSLADYACVRNPDIFKSAHLNPALASALSCRLMVVHELGDNVIQSEHFKTLSGGDVVPVEVKNSNDIISAKPQFTIVIDTNSVPRVPGEDNAFRDRLRVIPFKHIATRAELGKAGKEKQRELLEKGRIACFAWLVEGCSRYVREGLEDIPDEIRLATSDFATQLSDLGLFAKECIAKEKNSFISNADMMSCLEGWMFRNNLDIKGWTSNRITRRLAELGYKSGKQRTRNDDGSSGKPVNGFVDCKLISLKGDER